MDDLDKDASSGQHLIGTKDEHQLQIVNIGNKIIKAKTINVINSTTSLKLKNSDGKSPKAKKLTAQQRRHDDKLKKASV
jgi:hypothetical protein